MKIWTIQDYRVWELLQQDGSFSLNDESFIYESYLNAYKWLSQKMRKKIPESVPNTAWPIWGWVQWRDAKKFLPDLRYSLHLPTGTHGIRLCLDVNPEQILLSDFDDWHWPLNYFANNRNDINKPIPKKLDEKWARTILLEHSDLNHCSIKHRSVQATFWKIHLDQVIDTHEFIAK